MRSYLVRDWQHELSYRMNFVAFLAYPVIWVSVFALLGKTVQAAGVPNYARFIVLGTLLWRFVHVGFFESAISVRWEQRIGTYKHLFMIPRHPFLPVTAQAISGLTLSLVNFVLMVATAELVFDVSLGITPLGFGFLLVAWAGVLGFGLAIAGLAALYKEVNSIYRTVFFSFQLFSGVFFDWRSLPAWLHPLSAALPITHALDGLRLTAAGQPVPASLLWAILGTGLGALAIGAAILHLAHERAREKGVLEDY